MIVYIKLNIALEYKKNDNCNSNAAENTPVYDLTLSLSEHN